MKKLTAILAVVFLAAALVLSCEDGPINLNKFHDEFGGLEFLDTPEDVDMLVGEELALPIRTTSDEPFRILAESADCDIVSVYELNDSTVVLKALSEGKTTVTVSCLEISHDIHITVTEVYLNDFTVTPTSLQSPTFQEHFIRVDIDPEDYPVRHLMKEVGDTSMFDAIPYRDSASAANFVKIISWGVGRSSLTLTGKKKDGGLVSRKVDVAFDAIPVNRIRVKYPVDSTFTGYDTLKRIVNGRVEDYLLEKYRYTYKEITGGRIRMGLKDKLLVVMESDPENATLSGIEARITYGNEKTNIKFDDSAGDSKEAQELLDKLDKENPSSYEDYNKIFGSEGLKDSDLDKLCAMDRDMGSGHGFFCYRINPVKKGTAIVKCTAEYIKDIDGRTGKKTRQIAIVIENKDHLL